MALSEDPLAVVVVLTVAGGFAYSLRQEINYHVMFCSAHVAHISHSFVNSATML